MLNVSNKMYKYFVTDILMEATWDIYLNYIYNCTLLKKLTTGIFELQIPIY